MLKVIKKLIHLRKDKQTAYVAMRNSTARLMKVLYKTCKLQLIIIPFFSVLIVNGPLSSNRLNLTSNLA